MIEYKTGDIIAEEAGGVGQHCQLCWCYGPRNRAAIQEGVPREFRVLRLCL